MKTIEEAAVELSSKEVKNGNDYSHGLKVGIEFGFEKGVAFAQQWISVEDELPPCSDEDLLLRGIDDRGISGVVDVGYMHDSADGKPNLSNFISLGGILINITHWRPIERV